MSKIRRSARGQDCCVQIYPYCNHDPSTTVLAHINSLDKGFAIKSPDWWAVYACSDCHDVIDGRQNTVLKKDEVYAAVMRGIYRTQKRLIEQGLIKIDDN